ncbi:hypothetical protein BDK51DRAFT_28031 [Blyttiomyces helicus]|uniref:Uncharacterized protein n=1 Tax=Blyttiomyces helicus TaxID=388810 RepID=A0A4P9WTP0_9FUNG|nr:hypothetical protein BDK51DRAFT_28031 [Blyttiomyces helicus]|eukprot:RKO94730.1 hypothetical protein BDK51DRAFT_28031 [Blyttiomyces helicus]
MTFSANNRRFTLRGHCCDDGDWCGLLERKQWVQDFASGLRQKKQRWLVTKIGNRDIFGVIIIFLEISSIRLVPSSIPSPVCCILKIRRDVEGKQIEDHDLVPNMDAKNVLGSGSIMEAASIAFGVVGTIERFAIPTRCSWTWRGQKLAFHSRAHVHVIPPLPQIQFPGKQSIIPEVAYTIPISDNPTLPSMAFEFWFISSML